VRRSSISAKDRTSLPIAANVASGKVASCNFDPVGLNILIMSDTDQKLEDDVLRRMLATKPKPHKLGGKAEANPLRRSRKKAEDKPS
jgi:hypothetical protein